MIKDLIINGVHYAKYTINKEILYFKCMNNFPNKNLTDSEQACIDIIKDVEVDKFKTVAYLNS